ncbi:MAG: FAD:protein FMN transferase [Thiolinea sp.]
MPACVLAFFCLGLLSACSSGTQEPLRLQGKTMGTTWSTVVVAAAEDTEVPEATELQAGIEQVLRRVNDQMSTWLEDSELSRFNSQQSTDWFGVSAELVNVVLAAQQVSDLSGGIYDVTVGPLVNLWGFGAGKQPDKIELSAPSAAAIEAALANVGYQKLEVRKEPPSLRKQVPGLYVDLSSIAKGYGVDQVADWLEQQDVTDFMVEIGGEIRVRGQSPRADTWRIAVEKPVELGRAVQQGLKLAAGGLATSGDYRNFFMEGGRRYSHTLDPKTGVPVRHSLASVSVMAANTMLADAYATMLMAMGEDRGKTFALEHGLEAYFIWRTDDGFADYATPGFQAALLEAQD